MNGDILINYTKTAAALQGKDYESYVEEHNNYKKRVLRSGLATALSLGTGNLGIYRGMNGKSFMPYALASIGAGGYGIYEALKTGPMRNRIESMDPDAKNVSAGRRYALQPYLWGTPTSKKLLDKNSLLDINLGRAH